VKKINTNHKELEGEEGEKRVPRGTKKKKGNLWDENRLSWEGSTWPGDARAQ